MTKQTVTHSPEMFRPSSTVGSDFMGQLAFLLTFLKSRNTAVVMAVVLSGASGYFLKGRFQSDMATASPAAVEIEPLEKEAAPSKSLWANYRIDEGGRPVLLLASSTAPSK